MARKKSASSETRGSGLARAIRQCVDSGRVEFGANSSLKRALIGAAKLFVLASNCPREVAQDIQRFAKLSGVPVIVFEGSAVELGTIAGRPHPVAVLSVLDAGTSEIMAFAK
ncbi:MAG: 50S ribosomal protein L30e [Candidatus Micrarchaeota archaeon]|nr:50S ribosomal protein L30e [Candidatus Micrarchaeota archaeon]